MRINDKSNVKPPSVPIIGVIIRRIGVGIVAPIIGVPIAGSEIGYPEVVEFGVQPCHSAPPESGFGEFSLDFGDPGLPSRFVQVGLFLFLFLLFLLSII